MKKSLLFLLVAMLVSFNASAQSIEVDSRVIDFDVEINNRINFNNASRTATCGPDTVLYPLLGKATGVQILNLNNATSASALAQYYDVPLGSAVSISGAEFYGFTNSAANDILSVQVSVYSANPDSTPNAILATTNIMVDTVFGGGALSALLKSVTFPAPVVVTAPYLIVIENNSAISLAAVTNSWVNNDGNSEWLGFAQIGVNWLYGYELSLGADDFDADPLLFPIVTYDITSNFLSALDCFPQGQEVSFTNTSTPIISSRFYNALNSVGGAIDSSYLWNWGDGTETFGSEPPHTYNDGAASYDVKLYTLVLGWTAGCLDSAEMTFSSGSAPDAAFTTSAANEVVNFVDQTPEADSWLWDFGDGNTSTDQNPTHSYTASGSYTVCLTVTNCGLTDSTCMAVNDVWFTNINDDLLDQNLSVYPNPSTDIFNLALPLDKTEEVSVTVMNIVGQKVLDYNLGRVNTLDRQINLSGNNKGIYLLQVKVGERSVVRRITLN